MRTKFKSKTVTRKAILDAIHEFDRQYPNSSTYDDWLRKRSYIYAVLYDNRMYPPKQILSMATGISTTDFNGGEQTNRVFHQLGFEVKNK